MKETKQERLKKDLPPLESYQTKAIDFILSNWNTGINSLCALDVGMGKTRIACEIISRLFDVKAKIRLSGYVLICCSTSGVRDTIWADTLSDYNIRIITCESEQFRRKKIESKQKLSIPPMTACLITYANLYKEGNIEYFINTPPNLIVFDEYHTLTNNFSKKNQSYRNSVLKLPCRLRLGLTATPFINDEMESIIAYGILNERELVEKFYDSEKEEKEEIQEYVKEKKQSFLFYESNQNYLIQSKEYIVSIPMSKELHAQYLSVTEETRPWHMKNQHAVGKLTISPTLLAKDLLSGANSKTATGKVIALKSIINHLPKGDKIVIFDTYRDTLNHIKKLDFIRPLKPLFYVGGQKTKNKSIFERFNNDSEYRCLLTTRQEGGEGLNLQNANHLVMMNCWYTAKEIIQIFGRIKRKGQMKPVYAYLFGYNLYDCIGPGRPGIEYFLKEDFDFYTAIWRKTEMCEEWGLEIKNKLPSPMPFYNSLTFESDFNDFLNQVIITPQPMIESDELKTERNEDDKTPNESGVEFDFDDGFTLAERLSDFYNKYLGL
jgi:superfamily II DNA or RNA helicase